MERQGTCHEIERARGEGQSLGLSDDAQARAGPPQEAAYVLGLHYEIDAGASAKRIRNGAAPCAEHQGARKAALHIVEPLGEPLRRLLEQELGAAEARRSLPMEPHRAPIEHQDLALGHDAI